MATYLITDPDDITYEINTYTGTTPLFVDLVNKKIRLTIVGANFGAEGITLKAIYSKLKDIWLASSEAIKYQFPMVPITDESFELSNSWDFDKTGSGNTYTPNLIRTGGWTRKNAASVMLEQWAGVVTLGTIQAGGQVYCMQTSGDTAGTNFNLTGAVNQAIQTYSDPNGDGSTADGYDKRGYLKLFIREQGNAYATSQLSDIGVTGNMANQVYRFPLSDADDPKVTIADVTVDAYGVTITWHAAAQARTVNSVSRNFHVIIDGNNKTKEEIYMAVQSALRKATDIDAGAGTKYGKLTNELLYFIGSDLYTRTDTTGGVYIDNTVAGDNNYLHYMADDGIQYGNARNAVLNVDFGSNLQSDASAIYRVFFTNDDAGSNLGYDYGTANAITVDQMGAAGDMAGSVSAAASVALSYDIDNNIQRGAGSAGTNVPVTAVGIGLSTGQFVVATGTISATTLTGSVSLASALERNYTV
jgi:hypothetical protein